MNKLIIKGKNFNPADPKTKKVHVSMSIALQAFKNNSSLKNVGKKPFYKRYKKNNPNIINMLESFEKNKQFLT